MDSGKKENRAVKIFGYVFSYFLFTTILYYILKFTGKLPETWNYINIINITLSIVLVGWLLRFLLK